MHALRLLALGAVSLLVAACGGRSTSSIPAAANAASIARSVASAAAPSTATIYVGTQTSVLAFPLAGSGTLEPSRTIVPHPNQGRQTIDGLATNADGTLAILQNFSVLTTPTTVVGHCRVVIESATADGSPPASNVQCNPNGPTAGYGIARNTAGGFDLAFEDGDPNNAPAHVLRRFGSDGAGVVSSAPLGFVPSYLAVDRGGHDFLDSYNYRGEIFLFKAANTSGIADTTTNVDLNKTLSAIAVSPGADRTIYVAQYPDCCHVQGESIVALAPGSATPTRTIGPFVNMVISAMAVDAAGELIVAMNAYNGNTGAVVRVYAPDANNAAGGKPVPLRTIYPTVNGTPIPKIRALALYE